MDRIFLRPDYSGVYPQEDDDDDYLEEDEEIESDDERIERFLDEEISISKDFNKALDRDDEKERRQEYMNNSNGSDSSPFGFGGGSNSGSSSFGSWAVPKPNTSLGSSAFGSQQQQSKPDPSPIIPATSHLQAPWYANQQKSSVQSAWQSAGNSSSNNNAWGAWNKGSNSNQSNSAWGNFGQHGNNKNQQQPEPAYSIDDDPRHKKNILVVDLLDCLYESWEANMRPDVMPRGIFDLRPKFEIWDRLAAFSPKQILIILPPLELIPSFGNGMDAVTSYVTMSLSNYLRIPHQQCVILRRSHSRIPKVEVLSTVLNRYHNKEEILYVGVHSGKWGLSSEDLIAAKSCNISFTDIYDLLEGRLDIR